MSERDEHLLVEDILESGQKILRYTEGFSFDDFVADEKTVDAVVRNFEIIGEAVGRLSETFRADHSHIDWQRIRGFRNRIVHDYFGIDYSIVWNIIITFLPELTANLSQIDRENSPSKD
jgi:uncharacterized protein with HEPN domain